MMMKYNVQDVQGVYKYINARWVCAPEVVWRILKLPMRRMHPIVYRLQMHLPNMQHVHLHK